MNKKELFHCFALLGVGLLLLSAYQFNQYWATQAVVGSQLSQLDEIDPAVAEMMGVDLESMRDTVTATTSTMLQIAIADLVLGAALLFVGVIYAPR